MLPIEIWTTFIQRSCEKMLAYPKFDELCQYLYGRDRISSSQLCAAFFETQKLYPDYIDMRALLYSEILLKHGYFNSYDVFVSTLKSFSRLLQAGDLGISPGVVVGSQMEEALFEFALEHFNHKVFKTQRQVQLLLKLICLWMKAVSKVYSAHERGDYSTQEALLHAMSLAPQVGDFAVKVFETPSLATHLRELLSQDDIAMDATTIFMEFTVVINPSAPQTVIRIEHFMQSQPKVKEMREDRINAANEAVTVEYLQDQVLTCMPVHNRASLLIYLEALLWSCPTIDSSIIVSYLQARYPSNPERAHYPESNIDQAIIDFILASFDLLELQHSRGTSNDVIFLTRSFIVNKLPLILASLYSVAMIPIAMPMLISQALGRVPTETVERDTFLLACAVHGLITADNIEQFTGTKPVYVPAKAHKSNLLQQIQAGTQKIEASVSRLLDMDGNVSAYTEAIVDRIQYLCAERNAISLSMICNDLVAAPQYLDVMVLMVGYERLLGPLCSIIDTWPMVEDYESRLLYEEFGACFLLVMACVKRFNLSELDVASLSPNNLVAEIISTCATPMKTEDMTSAQQGYLTNWTKALFVDEEIRDKLMSDCPPRDFYKLLPSLLKAAIVAYGSGHLSKGNLNGGLELLFEPFLIPSILCATHWLSLHSFGASSDVEVLLMVMKELVKSGKAAPRDTILAISGLHLKDTLSNIKTHLKNGVDVDTLQQTLAPYLPYQRHLFSHQSNAVRDGPGQSNEERASPDFNKDFDTFCTWSIGLVSNAPSYSHQTLLDAVRKFGILSFVTQLVQCVKGNTEGGMGDLALDLAVTMIIALEHAMPRADSYNDMGTISLQAALKLELSRTPKYSSADPLQARIIILLARRIGTELTNAPLLSLDMPDTSFLDNIDLSTVSDLPIDFQQLDSTMQTLPETIPMQTGTAPSFQFDEATNAFDLDINAALAAQDNSGQALSAFSASGEEDIYAGLNLDNMMDWS